MNIVFVSSARNKKRPDLGIAFPFSGSCYVIDVRTDGRYLLTISSQTNAIPHFNKFEPSAGEFGNYVSDVLTAPLTGYDVTSVADGAIQ